MWWRAGCGWEILRAGYDGELGVMESCVWCGPIKGWLWSRAWRDGELGVMKSYKELGVMGSWVWWRDTESCVWWRASEVYPVVLFSSLPLWCRFIIIGNQRQTALPHHLHTFAIFMWNAKHPNCQINLEKLRIKNIYLMLLIYNLICCLYISSKGVGYNY